MTTTERLKAHKCVRWIRKTPLFAFRSRMKYRKEIDDTIDRCVGRGISRVARKKLQNKMIKALANDYFWFDEFFYYHYESLSSERRKMFATNKRRREFCNKVNPKECQELLDNKMRTYTLFAPYYHREVISIPASGEQEFESFVRRHPRFIVKPIDSCKGRGIKVMEHLQGSGVAELYKKLNEEYSGGGIIEEIIVQGRETALFHPESINTVRIATFRFENEVQILPPCFRIGRGNSVVDNAGAGGIVALLDGETGVVLGAADETGRRFFFHPDTGVQIVGYKLPQWDVAKNLAKQLALIVPDNRYIGWDLAWTDSGWIMIEGNPLGDFLWQIPTLEGFNAELTKIEKRYDEEIEKNLVRLK